MSIFKEGRLRLPVTAWLLARNMVPVFEVQFGHGNCDIVGVEFGERVGRAIPDIKQLVAIELKLTDFAGVVGQAKSNIFCVPKSYIAMPKERLDKLRSATMFKCLSFGVGVLGIADGRCSEIKAPIVFGLVNNDMQRKLWRRREEWKDRLRFRYSQKHKSLTRNIYA